MNRDRIIGAIRFPVFALIWAAGAALWMGQLKAADAMMPIGTGLAFGSVDAAPSLEDPDVWQGALAILAEHSDVLSGHWQPSREPSPTRATHQPLPREPDTVTVAELAGELPSAPAAAPAAAPAPVPAVAIAPAPDEGAAGEAVQPPVRETQANPKTSSGAAAARLARRKADARRALDTGRFDAAYQQLRPGVADGRGDPEYLGLLAVAALRQGSSAEALVIYQHLVSLEPESGRWRTGVALAQELSGLDATSAYRHVLAQESVPTELRKLVLQKLSDAMAAGVT